MVYRLIFLCTFFLLACHQEESTMELKSCGGLHAERQLRGEHGVVKLIGTEFWVISTSNNLLYACNIHLQWQVEGLSVMFDAKLYSIPPNVRMVGQPSEITRTY